MLDFINKIMLSIFHIKELIKDLSIQPIHFYLTEIIFVFMLFFILSLVLFLPMLKFRIFLRINIFFYYILLWSILSLYFKENTYIEFENYQINASITLMKAAILFIALIYFQIFLYRADVDLYKIPATGIILLNTMIFSIILMCSATNFITIYILLELFSLSSCILLTSNSVKTKRYLWALYYFMGSTLGSCLFLLSFTQIYLVTGTLKLKSIALFLENINEKTNYNSTILFFLILFVSSLLLKGGIVPFHFWIIKLYSELSYSILFFF